MQQNSPQLESTPDQGFDLSGILRQLWRRRRVFLIVFAAMMVPFAAVTFLLRPLYNASGAVIIGDLEPADASLAAWVQRLGDPADLESQLLIAQSSRVLRLALERPEVVDAVLEECNAPGALRSLLLDVGLSDLVRTPNCTRLKPGSDELLRYVGPKYMVRTEGRSRILSIGYRSPIPEVAFIMANALLISYLEDQRAENAHAREAATNWVLEAAPSRTAQSRSQENTRVLQPKLNFYQDLYNKVRDLETERRNLPNPARLVSLAEMPAEPYFPKRLPLLAAGLVIATVLAAFGAVRVDFGDRTIRRPRELEKLTSKPVLACLPLMRASAQRGTLTERLRIRPGKMAVRDWESPAFMEAARALHSRLLLSFNRRKGVRILIASAAPSEGKTYTTIAIARAAAETGRRVLLIDCDLRKRGAPGSESPAGDSFASVLRGETEPEAVVQLASRGVEVISAGVADGDPAMHLIDGQLAKLMKWAAERYDLVLLDGPSGLIPDLLVLAQHADGVLWCVRWGYTLLPAAKSDFESLQMQAVNLLGYTITMVKIPEIRHYE